MNIIIENRKAYHNYTILEKLEVGIVLYGAEVKSVREKMISIENAYVQVLNGELWLIGAHIKHYVNACKFSELVVNFVRTHTSKEHRDRKLLCHSKELKELKYKSEAKGFTIVPLKIYEKHGRFKLEIGMAKGKNTVDKRNTLKEKAIKRDMLRT